MNVYRNSELPLIQLSIESLLADASLLLQLLFLDRGAGIMTDGRDNGYRCSGGNVGGSKRPLPPAVETAHRILVEEGPLAGTDLKDRLKSHGFVQALERIQRYPDLYPDDIHLTSDGLLCIASATGPDEIILDKVHSDEGGWFKPTPLRVPRERIAVLDIETTGLRASADFITQIALVRLDGVPLLNVNVEASVGSAGPADDQSTDAVPIAEALRRLSTALESSDLVLGHNAIGFDLPFIRSMANRIGADQPGFPDSVDTLHLSLLVDVAMANRSLADILDSVGITNHSPHSAFGDAVATAAAVRALLDEVDIREPSWALAVAILESFGHPMARLMPELTSPPDLTTLQRPAEPLLDPSSSATGDAWSWTRNCQYLWIGVFSGDLRSGLLVAV